MARRRDLLPFDLGKAASNIGRQPKKRAAEAAAKADIAAEKARQEAALREWMEKRNQPKPEGGA
jgi:hypothetical protein